MTTNNNNGPLPTLAPTLSTPIWAPSAPTSQPQTNMPDGLSPTEQAHWHHQQAVLALHAAQQEAKTLAKYMQLPELKYRPGQPQRAVYQPIFKPEFDDIRDASMRLVNTCIFIGQDLYYVRAVIKAKDDILLQVSDGAGSVNARVLYSCPDIDLRSPEPQYINSDDFGPVWAYRSPARQQRQGICANNFYLKPAGREDRVSYSNMSHLMRGLRDQETVKWEGAWERLLLKTRAVNAIRLSPRVCFFRDKNKMVAEYKGRDLGDVKDDRVLVNGKDNRPWIVKDIAEIGCSVKEV